MSLGTEKERLSLRTFPFGAEEDFTHTHTKKKTGLVKDVVV